MSTNIVNLALEGIQKLIPYTPGKPILELQRELKLTHVVKLASNESPLGINPQVTTAMTKAFPDLSRYPDGSGFHLKIALSKKLGVNLEQITLGNGSNELLEIIARTFVNPEVEIMYSQHAFAVYPLVTQAVGATARVIPAKNYGHNLEAMLEAVNEKTRLIFIANPNNPTGTLLAPEALRNFISALPQTVLCVLDEAYFEFVSLDKRANSISWLTDFPHLIITRTFSKAYGLAGLRIGYSLSSIDIADLLNRVRQPFNNNSLALIAAETALADQDYLALAIKTNQEGMMQLITAFKALDLEWIPSSGNFISVDFKQPALPFYEALLQKGVIVRPVGGLYEMPHHLRISVGTQKENQFFIDTLTRIIFPIPKRLEDAE